MPENVFLFVQMNPERSVGRILKDRRIRFRLRPDAADFEEEVVVDKVVVLEGRRGAVPGRRHRRCRHFVFDAFSAFFVSSDVSVDDVVLNFCRSKNMSQT